MIEGSNLYARPSRYCPNCLGDTFVTHVRFDEQGQISWYLTRDLHYVKCVACDYPVTLPTEIDHIGETSDAT